MSRVRSQKATGELVGVAVGNVPYKIGDHTGDGVRVCLGNHYLKLRGSDWRQSFYRR